MPNAPYEEARRMLEMARAWKRAADGISTVMTILITELEPHTKASRQIVIPAGAVLPLADVPMTTNGRNTQKVWEILPI